jgi:hypothetical protein
MTTSRHRKSGAILLLAVLLTGCAGLQTNGCPVNLSPMLQADLYFGRALPGGGSVSDEDWRRFVDEEVTPRFPDGLTVTDASGQWRGQAGIIREASKHVTIILPSHDGVKLEAVRAAYRARFHQESVLLIETRVCGAF